MRKNRFFTNLILILAILTTSSCLFQTKLSIETVVKQGNPTPGTPYDAVNGSLFTLEANSLYTIRTNEGYEFDVKLQNAVNMTITEYTNHPLVSQMLDKHTVIATLDHK